MKILLGWEMGSGQGHIQRLMALAESLATYGATSIFALKAYDLKTENFPWQGIVAPRLPFTGEADLHTFADILGIRGFADSRLLRNHLLAWQDVLKTIQPDLIITDYAPGLVLAAKNRIPTVVIGSHFAVPPPVEQFPTIRFPASSRSSDRQRQVSETVRQLTQLDGTLGAALNGDRSFIYSLPELDCYRAWRVNPQYVGIHNAPLPSVRPNAAGGAWAYLAKGYQYRELVIQTLNPNCDFKPLHTALANRALAIHHGGLTTAIGCLLSGIPQLILPRQLEQQLTAFALVGLGVAEILKAPTWENLFIAQAQTHNRADNATHWADKLATWNENLTQRVVDTCLDLVA